MLGSRCAPFNSFARFVLLSLRTRALADSNLLDRDWHMYAPGECAACKRWLNYHARKIEGILSLLLCCYDMPFVVKHSGGPEYKQYGVHNGSRSRLKAWELHEKDEAVIQETSNEEFIVLQAMPKVLFIEMGKAFKEPYPGLPEK